MDALHGLLLGFAVALTPVNLFWCFVGLLPRHRRRHPAGPGAGGDHRDAAAAHLPDDPDQRAHHAGRHLLRRQVRRLDDLDPAQRAGRVGVRGDLLDGYQMAQQGRAGAALGIAAIASFIAGTVGVVGLMLVAPPLAAVRAASARPEYFALMGLGLAMVVLLAGESMVKALARDDGRGCGSPAWARISSRSTRASRSAMRRCSTASDFVAVAIGVFALAEVLGNLEVRRRHDIFRCRRACATCCRPWQDSRTAASRSSTAPWWVSSSACCPARARPSRRLSSYAARESGLPASRKIRHRRGRGRGRARGRQQRGDRRGLGAHADPGHTADGDHRDPAGGLILWGFKPGPLMIHDNPELFWGLVASMYIGNVMLLVLNLPLVPLFAQILRMPVYILYPIIFGISIVGVYASLAACSTSGCWRRSVCSAISCASSITRGAR